jgi:hypothetical protein
MDAIVTDMLRRSEWSESETIQNGDILSCQIDGEIVECAVKIDPKEICVKLLRKDIELTASAKLMLMAPVTYTTGAGTRIANDRCAMRLKQLMVGLYHDYRIIMTNMQQIKGLLPEFLGAKEEYNRVVEALNIKKKDLKKDFKEGRLSQKSYMEQLSDLKNQIIEQGQALNVSFSNIFNPVLSECTYCDNLVGVIQTLS